MPPSQMETEITRKIEDAVSTLRRHRAHQLEHQHRQLADLQIEFQFGTDMSQAMDDVRDAVSRIRPDLPMDATEPYIGRATTAGNAIWRLRVSSET